MKTMLLAPIMDDIPAANRSIRVWLVEDDPHYRETMSFLIKNVSGMTCSESFSDCEAVLAALEKMAAEEEPHVILMDVGLPGLSGIECTSRVKAQLPGAHIVMITIRDEEETIFEAFRAGASGYLLKNASVDQIIAAIREAQAGGMLMPAPVARKVLGFFNQQATSHQEPTQTNYGLTAREREVLALMTEGLTQKEIAERLFVSPSTVSGHIQHLYEKLHVHSSSAAVAKAIRERLV